ncbi:MAG: UPF0146 family protein [Haloarculaceae archaeon]
MREETIHALVARLAEFDRVVEVGVGNRPDVAAVLADTGVTVTATDVRERPTPEGIQFARDDVTDPDRQVYADADAIYALSLPPELHRPALDLALDVDAALLFTTLGGDPPAVPVERETLPGATLFTAKPQRP